LSGCFVVLAWPTTAASAIGQAAKAVDNNDVIYQKETTSGTDDVGFWAVYDTQVIPEKSRSKGDYPCCLMVKMKMVIKSSDDDQVLDRVPVWAVSTNDSCATYGQTEQELRIKWNSTYVPDYNDDDEEEEAFGDIFEEEKENEVDDKEGDNSAKEEDASEKESEEEEYVPELDSHLTMTFRMGSDAEPRVPYSEDEVWIWTSRLEFETPDWRVRLDMDKLFESPRLFSFTCKGKSVSLPAVAQRLRPATTPENDTAMNSSSIVSSSEVAFDSVGRSSDAIFQNVTLVFHHLEVEAFRNHRYYAEFTHMKWDCQRGWPYSHVPALVNLAMSVFTVIVAGHFAMRHRSWKLEQLRNEVEAAAAAADNNNNNNDDNDEDCRSGYEDLSYQADDEQDELVTSSYISVTSSPTTNSED